MSTADDAEIVIEWPENNPVVSVEVRGLFKKFDHTLRLDGEQRCLVIYGGNGVGKTATLRMLHALFAGSLRVFSEYPFENFLVQLGDGSEVSVAYRAPSALELSLVQPDAVPIVSVVSIGVVSIAEAQGGRFQLSFFDAVGHQVASAAPPAVPDWLARVRQSTNVRLIETDRTVRRRAAASTSRSHDPLDPVEWCAADLGRKLEQVATKYAAHAQSLDRTLPSRFVEGAYAVVSRTDLQPLLSAVLEGFNRMQKIGLLRDSDAPVLSSIPADIQDHHLRFLSLYATDARQKLVPVNSFAERVELFIEHVHLWLIDKRLTVTPGTGFSIADRETGERVPLAGLSSGEKHFLVMWHELLFCTSAGALVLIDEPEISWHVAWQKRFLEDLLAVANAVGCSVLIASHSPFIPGERIDLTSPLGAKD